MTLFLEGERGFCRKWVNVSPIKCKLVQSCSNACEQISLNFHCEEKSELPVS